MILSLVTLVYEERLKIYEDVFGSEVCVISSLPKEEGKTL